MVIKLCQHTEFCNEELQNPFAAALLIKQLPMVMMVIGWAWKWPFHATLCSKKISELKRIYVPTHSELQQCDKNATYRAFLQNFIQVMSMYVHVSTYAHRRHTFHYALCLGRSEHMDFTNIISLQTLQPPDNTKSQGSSDCFLA